MGNYEFSKIRSSDLIILVMGITGAGKSSLISQLLNEEVDIIGHNLTSYTSGVDFFMFEHAGGRRVFLMDTPGFDDTYRSNAEVLRDIAFILAQVYRHKLSVAGVIYMHRITDNRVSGSSVKNLEVLRKLCGPDAFSRIVLTTSMWDSVSQDPVLLQDALNRENQLKTTANFWGLLLRGGSLVMRWTDKRSAVSAVSHLVDLHDRRGSIVLKIQRELVEDGITLDDTESGRAVQDGFAEARAKYQADLRDLSSQFREAMKEGNNEIAVKLREVLDETKRHLEVINSVQATMKTDLDSLIRDKAQEYSKVLAQVQEDRRLMKESMRQYQEDRERLAEEEKANRELLEEARREREFERLSLAETLSVSSGTLMGDDEMEHELQKQFEEEQSELKENQEYIDKQIRRERRKMLVKKNSVPMLSILAGIGTAVGGGVLLNPGLVVAGVGLMASGASKLDFSKKPKTEEDDDDGLYTIESMISMAESVD
ncbi:P-loop containing nucleoside triphosphate hydrolase protein [Hypoxylon sp. NC1633]|nr:P-loop containing nucleoside triphosphate hydrolase protein [Hypoxylon sp. NC1633]